MVKDKSNVLGLSFLDRNWLFLVRLAKIGLERKEAEKIVRKMEKTGKSYEEINK